MAGGPTGTGWSKLVDELNIRFGDTNKRKTFAAHFKTKHGPKGDGGAGFTKYKFGRFVDKHDDLLQNDRQRGQFVLDSSVRHWDNDSHAAIEDIIKDSLAHNDASGAPAPKKITFALNQVATATKAKIEAFAERVTEIGVLARSAVELRRSPPRQVAGSSTARALAGERSGGDRNDGREFDRQTDRNADPVPSVRLRPDCQR